ncbi:class 1 fructose-bisphosphatase [Pedobacter sp. HMF7647]|uniref:Fructose-1,6-bisphosphatase class 1 n=1 Tax=Hufsiella arboris TaxID=2695275 RepID=A0A7K1Y5V2_9SPHI|nr:class 1 fructose-bisphosphatase [Hufsiella arboris]MXV49953.1 class 1 fructose-bisphosphatase [Hufsiella arboris]
MTHIVSSTLSLSVAGPYLKNEQAEHGPEEKEIPVIVQAICTAAKNISDTLRRGDFTGAGRNTCNSSGEIQHALDIYANEQFIASLTNCGECAALVSEECDDILVLNPGGQYLAAIDPLDGSSNTGVNMSLGSIFSIYRNNIGETPVPGSLSDSTGQLAAGYILYGPATVLVYTTGDGLNGFTLDPASGNFLLSHPGIHIPASGYSYSVNEGNYSLFPSGVKDFIRHCRPGKAACSARYSSRYTGTMVADIHRILFHGGIFIYPALLPAFPEGKLRLLYECRPMAFIIEQAGGKASDGYRRLMDIEACRLHQRTPVFIGSPILVSLAESLIAGAHPHSKQSLSNYKL